MRSPISHTPHTLPLLPKMPRQFLCTKCGSSTCDGSTDADHPPCSKCGYLGFAFDVGYTASQIQAYGLECRLSALEEAIELLKKIEEGYGVKDKGLSDNEYQRMKQTAREHQEAIRRLK